MAGKNSKWLINNQKNHEMFQMEEKVAKMIIIYVKWRGNV